MDFPGSFLPPPSDITSSNSAHSTPHQPAGCYLISPGENAADYTYIIVTAHLLTPANANQISASYPACIAIGAWIVSNVGRELLLVQAAHIRLPRRRMLAFPFINQTPGASAGSARIPGATACGADRRAGRSSRSSQGMQLLLICKAISAHISGWHRRRSNRL